MTEVNTREFKRTLRLIEQDGDLLVDSAMTLETVLVRHLRSKNSHALSEFLRSAVRAYFVQEQLALATARDGNGSPLHPAIQTYIENNCTAGGSL